MNSYQAEKFIEAIVGEVVTKLTPIAYSDRFFMELESGKKFEVTLELSQKEPLQERNYFVVYWTGPTVTSSTHVKTTMAFEQFIRSLVAQGLIVKNAGGEQLIMPSAILSVQERTKK